MKLSKFLVLFVAAKLAKLVILFAVLGIFSAPASVNAQEEGQETPFKVAVLDIQALLSQSKAAKSIQKQVEDKREDFQKEISKEEKKLKESEEKLIKLGQAQEEEKFKEQKKEFEEDFVETRELVQSRRTALEKAYNEAMVELRNEIVAIVSDFANENNYGLVLSKTSVVIGDKSLDITEDVMKRLDKDVSKIKVNVPK